MRHLLIAVNVFACVSGAAPSADATPPLTPESVRILEARLTTLPGRWPLDRYDRYYALDSKPGGVAIRAVFELAENGRSGSAHIVAAKDLPVIFDGGCAILDAVFDPVSKKALRLECNGVA